MLRLEALGGLALRLAGVQLLRPHLPTAEARATSGVMAAEIMRQEIPELTPESSAAEAMALLDVEESDTWPVVEKGRLLGAVTRAEIATIDPSAPLRPLIVKAPSFAFAHPDHSATQALDRMRAAQVDVLPVVSRTDVGHLLGIVTLRGILEAYGVKA